MNTHTERLEARMHGAKAALEGRKLDANTYGENDDLHFDWLAGWTSARLEMRNHHAQDASPSTPAAPAPAKEIPLFTFLRFNPRRAARGAEAAEVEATWPDGETQTLWMSEQDINNNAKDYGWQDGLRSALIAYRAAEA